jgi:hypothetical protein
MITEWLTRLQNLPLPEPFLVGMGAALVLNRVWPRRLPGSHRLNLTLGSSLIGAGSALIASSSRAAGPG